MQARVRPATTATTAITLAVILGAAIGGAATAKAQMPPSAAKSCSVRPPPIRHGAVFRTAFRS